jgi:hypothetical protein
MTDDGGVLENLPRSRPGRRSEKRASADAATTAKGSGAGAKRSGSTSKGSPSGPRRRAQTARPQEQARRSADPVGAVIRGAAKAAETGVRVAGAVAQEVLRRVPRP